MEDSSIVDAMPYLNRYALKLTRNRSDADDLVSMTIVKAIEIIRFKNLYVEKPNPYFGKIMYFIFISKFCRSKHRLDKSYDDGISSTEARQENALYLSEILGHANRLPVNDKKIVLAHIKGHSTDYILRKNRGYRTSKSTVHKIIKSFKEGITA